MPPFLIQVPGQRRVVGGLDHDGDAVVVLGGGADHGGAADVDLLDAGGEVGAAGEGGLERVEVDHHEVDRRRIRCCSRVGDVVGVVAAGEDAAVDGRVQGLDPAVQDLGRAGDLADLGHGHGRPRAARVRCRRWRPARRRGRRGPRASSTRPVLSWTERSARRIGRKVISTSGAAAQPGDEEAVEAARGGEVAGQGADLAGGRQVDGEAAQLARAGSGRARGGRLRRAAASIRCGPSSGCSEQTA